MRLFLPPPYTNINLWIYTRRRPMKSMLIHSSVFRRPLHILVLLIAGDRTTSPSDVVYGCL